MFQTWPLTSPSLNKARQCSFFLHWVPKCSPHPPPPSPQPYPPTSPAVFITSDVISFSHLSPMLTSFECSREVDLKSCHFQKDNLDYVSSCLQAVSIPRLRLPPPWVSWISLQSQSGSDSRTQIWTLVLSHQSVSPSNIGCLSSEWDLGVLQALWLVELRSHAHP